MRFCCVIFNSVLFAHIVRPFSAGECVLFAFVSFSSALALDLALPLLCAYAMNSTDGSNGNLRALTSLSLSFQLVN